MTTAPVMLCKRALEEASGDLSAALSFLRKRGFAVKKGTPPIPGSEEEQVLQVAELIAGLSIDDPEVRQKAANALLAMPSRCVAEALVRLVSTTAATDAAKSAALEVLERLSFPDVQSTAPLVSRITGAYFGSAAVSERIARLVSSTYATLGCDAVANLITEFKRTPESQWLKVTSVLANIGSVAVGPLISASRHNDPELSVLAGDALKQISDPKAVPELIQAAAESGLGTRRAAIEALGKIGDVRAIPRLLEVFENEQLFAQGQAAEALIKLGWRPDGETQAVHCAIHLEYGIWRPPDRVPFPNSIDALLKTFFKFPRVRIDRSGFTTNGVRYGEKRGEGPEEAILLSLLPFSHLTREIAHWVSAAIHYEVLSGDEVEVKISLARCREAVSSLCGTVSPITSNILILVTTLPAVPWERTNDFATWNGVVDFREVHEMAASELKRRGSPAYLPEAYYKKQNMLPKGVIKGS